jgi:hypothetical protein
MRNGFIGLASAMALALTMATVGCSSSSNSGGSGGSSNSGGTTGTGGSSNTGGTGVGGTSGGNSVTSLSGSKAINTLTTTEATQLCNDVYAYFGRAISRPTMCKSDGLTRALSTSPTTDVQLQDNCKAQESSCLKANPANPGCSDIPSTCTATVAQYSDCMVDQAASLNEAVPKLATCTTVTLGDKPQLWAYITRDLPATCISLTDMCPSLNFPSPQGQ